MSWLEPTGSEEGFLVTVVPKRWRLAETNQPGEAHHGQSTRILKRARRDEPEAATWRRRCLPRRPAAAGARSACTALRTWARLGETSRIRAKRETRRSRSRPATRTASTEKSRWRDNRFTTYWSARQEICSEPEKADPKHWLSPLFLLLHRQPLPPNGGAAIP
jgi:hypothetical protein